MFLVNTEEQGVRCEQFKRNLKRAVHGAVYRQRLQAEKSPEVLYRSGVQHGRSAGNGRVMTIYAIVPISRKVASSLSSVGISITRWPVESKSNPGQAGLHA